jgi:hypothetical protein
VSQGFYTRRFAQGVRRNERVAELGKSCYFRHDGSWWVAAEFGGGVFVRRLASEPWSPDA